MNHSMPGLPVHHQLLESTQAHVHRVSDALLDCLLDCPSNNLILCCPLLLLPSIFPSIGVFTNESALHIRWPKYWSFSFNISPSTEQPGLISLRMDWLDLLAVQGTLKSLLQHHSSKASILRHSTSFIVQLSHQYITTGKTIALTMPLNIKYWICSKQGMPLPHGKNPHNFPWYYGYCFFLIQGIKSSKKKKKGKN